VWKLLIGLVLALTLGVAAWYAGWQFIAVPSFSCSLPVSDPCEHTADKATTWALSGRPIAINLRPAPEEWATSTDPGFRHAQWAARVERFLQPPILAACYYSSGQVVTCQEEQAELPAI